MAEVCFHAVGRRKKAIARVRLIPGEGNIVINKRPIDEYFGLETLKTVVRQPLTLTDTLAKFDVIVNVTGGGYTGQAGAIRHGIARALVKADEEIRALVLTGCGEKAFVAGADIGEMSTLTKAGGEAFGKKGNDVFRKLETLPIPTIAAVNGFALGGGCELSMSCDIRICADTAVFGQPEAGLGITPGFGGTQRLARLVGPGMAKQLIYTAKNIKADEAMRIGLVNAVYPLEELMPAAEKLAATIAKNAPIAVRACKKAINDGLQVDMDAAVVIEEKLFGSCFESADQKEGMGAFLEKRKHEPYQNK